MGYDVCRVADVGGNRVPYHETGTGEPLLLHHGAESHRGQYAIFAPLLRSGIRAISYDQRDVGDAEYVDADYTMQDLADDCVGLMDALDIEKAHIMGVSFGGAIALYVAARHPDRVRSLVVGATPDSFARPTAYLTKMMASAPEERAALMRNASLSPEAQRDEWLLARLADLGRGTVTALGSRRRAVLEDYDVRGQLSQITAPTLLVYGELDPLAPPEVGEDLHARLTSSELVVLEGARHGLSFEFREQTAALVNDWVSRHEIGPVA
ncbi:alpha/beta fold hydrolase [Prauserella cavernicola]|uniref:Alpha/beta hydrolase n=1 Tax=Prauserella cavernicola TaxID=2800127 RepID=A0A934V702_9PSEU|nr:alpha/beta hydrolase [Prauserella cavernicola]MBK1787209.1 alpha/beta hydrolase [Prauserella cavernicola]